MSIAAILGAITAISSIIGGIVYIFKYSSWALSKTEDQKNQTIDSQIADEKKKAEETGRPV